MVMEQTWRARASLSQLPVFDVAKRPRQEPDRYTEVRSVWSVVSTAHSLCPSLLFPVGVLLVVVVVLNPDVGGDGSGSSGCSDEYVFLPSADVALEPLVDGSPLDVYP